MESYKRVEHSIYREKLAKATGISLSIILDDIRDFVKELQVNGYILNDNSQ